MESVRPRNFNHSSWKGDLDFPEEPFLSENLGESFEVVKWVKFTILMDDSNKVYFQDSRKYLFHYDFAKVRLKPFRGMTAEEFNDSTLYLGRQKGILGAVLVAPYSKEYAVQFIGQDAFPKEMMKFLFDTVTDSINGVDEWDSYLMPVAAHASNVLEDQEYYNENNHDACINLALLPLQIRGFGHVKEQAINNSDKIRANLKQIISGDHSNQKLSAAE